jgi:cytochrome P450
VTSATSAGESAATTVAEALDPFPLYHVMRAVAPVYFDERHDAWSVFRYDDVLAVLSDHTRFSSRVPPLPGAAEALLAGSLVRQDPPRHTKLRALAADALSPRATARLSPRIDSIVHELLDAVAPSGRMDVIQDLAFPLPVTVIAELLGVPHAERDQFKRWSSAIVTGGPIPAQTAERDLAAYFRQHISLRRRHGCSADDFIAQLLAAERDDGLTEPDIVAFCVVLLVAASETTTNAIGNAVLTLDEHPDARSQLQDDPALLPSAVEEVLRFRSPVQWLRRVAVADATLRGRTVPAGARVVTWIGSANRDEAHFPDADRFVPGRTPNRHLSFGYGPHFCVGAALARQEICAAVGALLARFHDLVVLRDAPLEPSGTPAAFGVKRLPVTFRPAR